MADPLAVQGAGVAPAIPFAIPEDSIFRKAASCIPIVGIAFQIANDYSIQQRCFSYTHSNTPVDTNRLIYMLNVKNHYNVALAVQSVLTIALIASTFALGILGSYMVLPAIMLGGVGLTGLCLHRIYHQKNIVTHLQANGFNSRMKLW